MTGTSMTNGRQDSEFLERQQRMVDEQLRRRGVTDKRVLAAMLAVPRELFLPDNIREQAYEDRALPIECGQTISQPYIVAYMTQELGPDPDSKVLEVGTGTGYQTAVLAALFKHVFTIERIEDLRRAAQQQIRALNVSNITFSTGDGSLGLPEFAPYDRILVTAAAPRVPEPLVDQLADGGRLLLPVGGAKEQNIVRVVRRGARTTTKTMLGCRFVKLIGKEAWVGGRRHR